MKQGTLVRGFGGFYVAVDEHGTEHILRCKKKFRRMHISPLVGDELLFTPGEGEEHGWVEEILPRKTECLRPPEPDLLLVDRLLVRARLQGMKTAIVVNKSDLDASLAEDIRRQYAGADCEVLTASAKEKHGLDALKAIMQGESCC